MLLFDSKLIGLKVASVQAAHQIGEVNGYVLNPRNLSIPALYVHSYHARANRILHTSDIRSLGNQGVLIDHDEQLMEQDDLVRLKEIIAIDFELIGKLVVTEDDYKLGKVASFVFDSHSWMIMKLHVKPSIVKNMGVSELIIHRQQIIKVSDSNVIVKSTAAKGKTGFSWKKLLLPTASKPSLEPETTSRR